MKEINSILNSDNKKNPKNSIYSLNSVKQEETSELLDHQNIYAYNAYQNEKSILYTKSDNIQISSVSFDKFQDTNQYNEFTSGFNLKFYEYFFIFFILCLWFYSLRKCFRNFAKIQTIHYREMPYKYRSTHAPQNISKVISIFKILI
jgi:hypothetical protein